MSLLVVSMFSDTFCLNLPSTRETEIDLNYEFQIQNRSFNWKTCEELGGGYKKEHIKERDCASPLGSEEVLRSYMERVIDRISMSLKTGRNRSPRKSGEFSMRLRLWEMWILNFENFPDSALLSVKKDDESGICYSCREDIGTDTLLRSAQQTR